MSGDLFSYRVRPSEAYRAERLMRRLQWAMARNDEAAIERLESRLDALERDMEADLSPGMARTGFRW